MSAVLDDRRWRRTTGCAFPHVDAAQLDIVGAFVRNADSGSAGPAAEPHDEVEESPHDGIRGSTGAGHRRRERDRACLRASVRGARRARGRRRPRRRRATATVAETSAARPGTSTSPTPPPSPTCRSTSTSSSTTPASSTCARSTTSSPSGSRLILRLMVEAPFLLIRAALPGMYERGFGPDHQHLSVHGLRRVAVQVGVRHRQARARGPVQGRPRSRAARTASPQLHQPRLRAHAAGREADRRPGAGARHPGGRGARAGHAHRDRRSSDSSSPPRWRPGGLARRRRTPEWSPAPATPWTADGARDESGARSARPTRPDRRVGLRRR